MLGIWIHNNGTHMVVNESSDEEKASCIVVECSMDVAHGVPSKVDSHHAERSGKVQPVSPEIAPASAACRQAAGKSPRHDLYFQAE
jgi:hypothetical protein